MYFVTEMGDPLTVGAGEVAGERSSWIMAYVKVIVTFIFVFLFYYGFCVFSEWLLFFFFGGGTNFVMPYLQ